MTDTNSSLYQTRDLYFASYLQAKKVNLVSVDKAFGDKGSFSVFVFSPKEICEMEEINYFRNEANVDAKHFADSIKYLKQLIHK